MADDAHKKEVEKKRKGKKGNGRMKVVGQSTHG
jgi:hypothetical protein